MYTIERNCVLLLFGMVRRVRMNETKLKEKIIEGQEEIIKKERKKERKK